MLDYRLDVLLIRSIAIMGFSTSISRLAYLASSGESAIKYNEPSLVSNNLVVPRHLRIRR
jgi:hypothetical protein